VAATVQVVVARSGEGRWPHRRPWGEPERQHSGSHARLPPRARRRGARHWVLGTAVGGSAAAQGQGVGVARWLYEVVPAPKAVA